jgi:hypothetical protein
VACNHEILPTVCIHIVEERIGHLAKTTALDTDRDGVLSSDELKDASQALRALDRNADGQLTADETGPPSRRGGSGLGG